MDKKISANFLKLKWISAKQNWKTLTRGQKRYLFLDTLVFAIGIDILLASGLWLVKLMVNVFLSHYELNHNYLNLPPLALNHDSLQTGLQFWLWWLHLAVNQCDWYLIFYGYLEFMHGRKN